ncbi:MAG: TRAP transporter large permease subunit [Gammaproteobacteria bacterium]|nr:TRAP transporter large permease subunit [Gammaproteobacteria bacterium]
MELFFLAVLFILMVGALGSGFPVAFSLPGSAILTIGLAALCGWFFAGDTDAYFTQGGPVQWLSAGVTNFRSLYWDVERDTLIAIPLFVFMGIMLQRSRIAEDLLVTMAQLFGPIPGGLGISVVFVGALLAATTGIVGATVIAMGLISLPAMLRHKYSHTLAAGTVCASGTLGQIIPPSIVLIILADQLSGASDIANGVRFADYKASTGQLSMPSEYDVTPASAGDMFMGALLPGLILVALYMAYILISSLIRPKIAPPVPYDGAFDREFAKRVSLALVPPLVLIFAVLGSIIAGVATVNQAGAIGAIGATIMAGYRLTEGQKNCYIPAVLAVVAFTAIVVILSFYDLNIKNVQGVNEVIGLVLAGIATAVLLIGVIWSGWRTFKINDTMHGVMIETAKTTSMVFIILIGAAMLTSAFRAFGGEELVRDFLGSLPGGFWTQFIVVMAVIFLLGFFLDFIEIAVVVVPIIAPILLADPSANITAVWLGVMIGINIQTSFLTPPFGFALFYLRGVASKVVSTIEIYKGAVPFIILQLVGLAIAGYYPSLVNYLPNRIHLTSETAPPPMNPQLQECLEEFVFAYYDSEGEVLSAGVARVKGLDVSYLPESEQKSLRAGFDTVVGISELVAEVVVARDELDAYIPDYRPLHRQVRRIERQGRRTVKRLEELERKIRHWSVEYDGPESEKTKLESEFAVLTEEREASLSQIPGTWKGARDGFNERSKTLKKAQLRYRRSVDGAYEHLVRLQGLITDADQLAALGKEVTALKSVVENSSLESAISAIKVVEKKLGVVAGSSKIKSKLSKARRALKKKKPKVDKALNNLSQAEKIFQAEVTWRVRAKAELLEELSVYDELLKASIGLRMQRYMTTEQAQYVAVCHSHHKDVSLNF